MPGHGDVERSKESQEEVSPAKRQHTGEQSPADRGRLTGQPDRKWAAAPGPADQHQNLELKQKQKELVRAKGLSEPVMLLKHFWVIGPF